MVLCLWYIHVSDFKCGKLITENILSMNWRLRDGNQGEGIQQTQPSCPHCMLVSPCPLLKCVGSKKRKPSLATTLESFYCGSGRFSTTFISSKHSSQISNALSKKCINCWWLNGALVLVDTASMRPFPFRIDDNEPNKDSISNGRCPRIDWWVGVATTTTFGYCCRNAASRVVGGGDTCRDGFSPLWWFKCMRRRRCCCCWLLELYDSSSSVVGLVWWLLVIVVILWHGIWSLLAPIVIWNEAAAFVLFCYWLLMTLSLLGRCFNSILALWADAQFSCVFLGRWNFWHMTAPNGSSGTFWKSISCMSHLCHTI